MSRKLKPVSPGEMLAEEFLKPLGMSQKELALHLGCDVKVVNRIVNGRTSVTAAMALKLGASFDGRTALADGTSKWITGDRARADVQRLRARASAILTGSGTVLADDPMLTVRDPELEMRGRRPLRVVLDSQLRTPADAQLLSFAGSTLILARDADSPLAVALREGGARVEAVRGSESGLDLEADADRRLRGTG